MISLVAHKLELVLRGLSYIEAITVAIGVQFILVKMHNGDLVTMFVSL